MNRERLEKLVDLLLTIRREEFNIYTWYCGTAACALGWAAKDPQFNREGLYLCSLSLTRAEGQIDSIGPLCPVYKGAFGFGAAEKFFEISADTARHLFDGSHYDDDPTPCDVALRVVNLLERER